MGALQLPIYEKIESGVVSPSTTSGSYVDLITLAAMAAQGYPVQLQTAGGQITVDGGASLAPSASLRILRDGVEIHKAEMSMQNLSGTTSFVLPSSVLNFLDFDVTAGSRVYKIQGRINAGVSVTLSAVNFQAIQRKYL